MDSQLTNRSPAVAARLTPAGRGAVAVVAIAGDAGVLDYVDSHFFRAVNGKRLVDQGHNQIVFGQWGGGETPGEDVVICRRGPASVEVHCHGGEVAVRRILSDLQKCGCATVDSSALARARTGVSGQELSAALSEAPTARTAAILLDQWAGTWRKGLETIYADIARWIEQSAVRLRSYPGAPGTAPTPADMEQSDAGDRVRMKLQEVRAWSRFGRHLTQPWSVVLGGRPNVGKSSLLNRLLGYSRAIVFDEPGTTRDVVTGDTAIEGWPVRLSDTAGIRETADGLEAEGIALARRQFESADCRLLVVDGSQPPTSADLASIEAWPEAIVVAHKSDLPDQSQGEWPAHAVRVSSLLGTGVEELLSRIAGRLVPKTPATDTPLPLTLRQVQLLDDAIDSLAVVDYARCGQILHALLG